MMEINIRIAGPDDAPLLAGIGRQAFAGAFADQNTAEDMQAYLDGAFSLQKQATELADPRGTFFIAESNVAAGDNRAVVGYARLFDGPSPACMIGKKAVELHRFYLLPGWIGSGAAGPLMQAVLNYARGGGWEAVWLGVWQMNPRAVRFYQKSGFGIVGEQIFQLGSDPQHDWIMAQDLEQGSGG
jgi:GNAT superfamily N-acetyltransferase